METFCKTAKRPGISIDRAQPRSAVFLPEPSSAGQEAWRGCGRGASPRAPERRPGSRTFSGEEGPESQETSAWLPRFPAHTDSTSRGPFSRVVTPGTLRRERDTQDGERRSPGAFPPPQRVSHALCRAPAASTRVLGLQAGRAPRRLPRWLPCRPWLCCGRGVLHPGRHVPGSLLAAPHACTPVSPGTTRLWVPGSSGLCSAVRFMLASLGILAQRLSITTGSPHSNPVLLSTRPHQARGPGRGVRTAATMPPTPTPGSPPAPERSPPSSPQPCRAGGRSPRLQTEQAASAPFTRCPGPTVGDCWREEGVEPQQLAARAINRQEMGNVGTSCF